MRGVVLTSLLMVTSACSNPRPPAEPSPSRDTTTEVCARSAETPAAPETETSRGYAPSRTLDIPGPAPAQPAPDRWSVRRIGGAPAGHDGASRPRRTKKIDIDLVAAPFEDVARLLSDAGRFNVVVESPAPGPVTVRLMDIDPYDALVVIAESRGVDVRYRSGVVIVGGD